MASLVERETIARLNFIRRVRSFMRDHAELNMLIDGEENSDVDIENAMELVLEDFSACPPDIGGYHVSNFPNLSLLMTGTIGKLIESRSLLLARNDVDLVSGTMRVNLPQPGMYLQMADRYWRQYEMQRDRTKAATNLQLAIDAAGGVSSDWKYMNRPAIGLLSQ